MSDLTLLSENNFKQYRKFIIDCLEDDLIHKDLIEEIDLFANLKCFQDIVLYLNSKEIYIPLKNNKLLGLIAIQYNLAFNEISASIIYNPFICPLSVVSLHDDLGTIVSNKAYDAEITSKFKFFKYVSYRGLLLNPIIKKFKKYEIVKVNQPFIYFHTNLSSDNINDSE